MRARENAGTFDDKRMLSVAEASTYCGLGRTRTRELAESAGAVRRFGRRVLFDKTKLDAALDSMTE